MKLERYFNNLNQFHIWKHVHDVRKRGLLEDPRAQADLPLVGHLLVQEILLTERLSGVVEWDQDLECEVVVAEVVATTFIRLVL